MNIYLKVEAGIRKLGPPSPPESGSKLELIVCEPLRPKHRFGRVKRLFSACVLHHSYYCCNATSNSKEEPPGAVTQQ